MLLYIFWHWPRPEVAIAGYEAGEAVFQAAVRNAKPAGLLASGSSARQVPPGRMREARW